ncbi:hypothetical protein D3C85_1049340 [compost metagenome]
MFKERQFVLLLVIDTGGFAKINIAQVRTIAAHPAPMVPRACYQNVVCTRVLFFNSFISGKCTVGIFGIEETTNDHHSRFNIG